MLVITSAMRRLAVGRPTRNVLRAGMILGALPATMVAQGVRPCPDVAIAAAHHAALLADAQPSEDIQVVVQPSFSAPYALRLRHRTVSLLVFDSTFHALDKAEQAAALARGSVRVQSVERRVPAAIARDVRMAFARVDQWPLDTVRRIVLDGVSAHLSVHSAPCRLIRLGGVGTAEGRFYQLLRAIAEAAGARSHRSRRDTDRALAARAHALE